VKFFLDNWMLMVIALTSGAALMWPILAQGAASGLTTAQAVQLINREKAVVIDVCEPEEFAQGHVSGAKNVPLAQLEIQLPKLVKNKATPVVVLCQAGSRAARGAAQARKMGYEQAQPLAGGLKAWREASLPIDKT
jgi:rhodanese-related sulfurtransferase